MKRITTLVLALWAVFVTQNAFSQKGSEEQLVKEANSYFTSGEYLKAFPLYSQLVSLYPNHPDYNYRFGACAIYSDADKTKAVKFLTLATNKGVEDKMAWYYLGKAYHLNYQFKDAIKAYENFMRNADPKVSAKTDVQREIETCIYGSNLLANINDISVISKTESDKGNFFRYFNLEAIGGKILTIPDALKSKLDDKSKEPGIIHYPGSGTTIYFSSFGKDGSTGKDIYKAQVLPDGKFSTPVKIEGDVNTKYDEDYCFMHSDGKTLYFSSRGHNSMGGYDIFKSVYDPKEQKFGPAINLDFAINTPDDDIFYIADSLNQTAYFASGRASDLNHLNVYNVLVETTPLQIVYIKGAFISEINNEQKTAGIKVIDEASGRMVFEGVSGGNEGNYMLYVPKSGEFNFKVITENSPTVHEVKVMVPSFGKTVALRQEMRLVSDNGKDKLIVTNYFDNPLDEDISALASEMLRKKSVLDVNSTGNALPNKGSDNDKSGELSTFDKTIENATIAAGFANGTKISDVVSSMQKESDAIKTFLKESDLKRENSFSYALKKQTEAEAALAEAENIRKSLGNISTDADIKNLRKSVMLSDNAESLQMEAKAALNVAESIDQYKSSETERNLDLEKQITAINAAEKSGNYDQTVAALTVEKDRQTSIRNGANTSPYEELMAKAKARESEQVRNEEKLTTYRDSEKEMVLHVKEIESKLAVTKKAKEKEAVQNELANANAELDGLRRNITTQKEKVEQSGAGAKLAFANAEFFKNISTDSKVGLATNEQVKLNDTDKSKLSMRLEEMNNRISALEITDPQMLAMVNDEPTSETSNESTAKTERIITPDKKAEIEMTAVSPAVASTTSTEISRINQQREQRLALAGTQPEMAPVRRMFLSESLTDSDAAIFVYENKKLNGAYTEEDNKNETDLLKLNDELHVAIDAGGSIPSTMTAEQLRATYTAADPQYNEKTQAIVNSSGSEMDRTIKMMDYKEQLILKLNESKIANTKLAAQESDQSKLLAIASKDQQYESAITALYNEINDVNQFKSAYESENKLIIQNDQPFNQKLASQIEITQNYADVLEELQADKLKELDRTINKNKIATINAQLADLREEITASNTRLEGYHHDLALTTSAGEPNSEMLQSANLEDMMAEEIVIPKANAQPEKSQVEEHAVIIEKMLKRHEEPESIFAYESGSFEEIIAEHQKADKPLKHREKITEINDQIFLIEAEMENEQSQSKLRKLDYKAEQMYLRRSMIEIDNSAAIAEMTKTEYEEEGLKAQEMVEANREKIDSRIMLRDEIKRLQRESEVHMNTAAEIRTKAPSIIDDIEKADFYRQAFAKESLAIDQIKQMQAICENIDMLSQYSETDLTQLCSGKVPSDMLTNAMAENAGLTSTADIAAETTPAVEPATNEEFDVDYSAPKGTGNPELTQTSVSSTEGADKVTQPEIKSTASDVVEMTSQIDAEGNKNQVLNFTVGNDGSIVTDSKKVFADENNVVNVEVKAEEPTNVKSQIAPVVAETISAPAPKVEKTTSVAEVSNTAKSNSEKASSSTATAKASAMSKPGESASKAVASGNASDYYYSMPDVLVSDLFVRTPRAVYSENKPIPVDIAMPSGVYYKVQVGAFRNDIPQNLYDEFAPVCGESLNNGITRYTAGLFMSYGNADKVKKEIRSIGYSDAFVVAFRDGKRIPLYEAMAKTDGESFAANVEKEYVYGDKGEAPKPVAPKASAESVKASAKPANTDYYQGVPNAAKATKVETVTGLFFTVQVGVYSKPVPAKSMYSISLLNSELTESKKIRYTAGIYTSMMAAVEKRSEAKNLGIGDAFITAYYNGRRITLSEADRLLKENGPSILAK